MDTSGDSESDGGSIIYECFGLILNKMQIEAGGSTSCVYVDNIGSRHKSLVRVAI